MTKEYPGPVAALRGVDLTVGRGELLAIVGPSGSGKSTLLHIIGTLDLPTAGSVTIAGHDAAALTDRRLSALRAQHIGFVFQAFHLVPGISAQDNVAEGLLYCGLPRAERRKRAAVALERVGLGDRMRHRPHELSGVRSSAWPSPAPSSASPICCSRTSRRARSTRRPARR